jgi:hypothetical protein
MSPSLKESRLDEHLRLRLGDLSPALFERFFLSFFNAGISLPSERNGRSIESQVIEANTYAAGSGRAQQGVDLIARMEGGETWVFQCKRVKKWSLAETREAIKKASGFPADRYFLLVACDPSVGVEELIEEHPNWTLWNLDRICAEFRRRVPKSEQPTVLNFLDPLELKRFAPYATDALISPEQYWESVTRSDESFFHKYGLVGREAQISELETFSTQGVKKVLLITGSGGEGKSRLVYEFSKRFQERHSETKIVFLNPHSSSDLLTSLWSIKEPRIIVVDDAHRLECVSHDLLNSVRDADSTKLILLTRPQGNEALEEKLRFHGLLGLLKKMKLFPLKKREIKQLAEEVLGAELHHYVPHLIARTGDSPFLTTLAGDLLRRKKITVQEWASDREFYRAVLRSFKEDNLSLFPPNDQEQADQLLRIIALLAPVLPNAEFMNKAGECLGIPAVRVEKVFHHLQSVGVISAESKNVRVIPDLFSDYLVFDTAFDSHNRLPVLAETILKVFSLESAVLIRNLAEAAWLAQSEAINRDALLHPLLEAEFLRFDDLSFYERGKMLEDWAAFSVFLPKESLELARRAMGQKTAKKPYSSWGSAASEIDSYNFTASKIPILLKPIALYLDDYRHEALDLIWPLGLPVKKKKDARSHPWEVIAEVIRFDQTKPIEVSVSALEWVFKLVARESTREILESSGAMLSILLSPCFAREVEGTEWQGRTITWWTRPVDVERTSGIRDQALGILRWVIENRSWRAAVSVIGTLGYALERAVGFRVQVTNAQKYLESWRPERLKALGLVEEILRLHEKAPVRYAIRQWLLQDQAYEEDPVFKKQALQILSSITDDLDLQITLATLTQSHYEFYEELGNPSGSEFHEQSHQLWNEKLMEIAIALIRTYPEPSFCISFLDQMAADLSDSGYSPSFYHLFPAISRVNASYGANLTRVLLKAKERNIVTTSWFELLLGLDSQTLIEELLGLGKSSSHAWLRKGVIMYLLFKCPLSAVEKQLINELAPNAESEEIYQIIQLIQRLGDEDVQWGYQLLQRLKLDKVASEQQHELLQDLYPYRPRSVKPSLSTVNHVLNALVPVEKIEIDHSLKEFNELAKDYPEAMYTFIVHRLHHAESLSENEFSYRPLFNPYCGSLDLSALKIIDQYQSICEFLWSKVVLTPSENTHSSWVELFQMVVMDNTGFWLPRLLTKIDTASQWNELRSLVDLISFDGSLIIFRFPQIPSAFLKKAEDLDGMNGVKRMQLALYIASGPKGRSFTNGNLDPGSDYLEAEALKAMERHADNPVLRPFYRWITQLERDERERTKSSYELTLKACDD